MYLDDNKSRPTTNIYKSKIANVPTPGYSGHTSIFVKPISYLNKDKIDVDDTKQTFEDYELSPAFIKTLNGNNVEEDVKYFNSVTLCRWV